MIELASQGLYCRDGNFYIDPHRVVETAVITHAHSDHARRGSKLYICVHESVRLLKSRLGERIDVKSFAYGEVFSLGNARVSFHPAGHILGSAQVRVEVDRKVWVASGDYKREPDPTCAPFEVVPCDVFITEATFGAPSFQWKENSHLGEEIYDWWLKNEAKGINSVLYGYSLGKAQRVLGELRYLAHKPVYTDPNVTKLTECYRAEGVELAKSLCLSELNSGSKLRGEFIIIPPGASSEKYRELLGKHETAFASGWVLHGTRGYDRGFRMSDHADWNALIKTIQETGAREVYVQHREGALIRHLKKNLGIEAFSDEALVPGFHKNTHLQLSLFDKTDQTVTNSSHKPC